MATREKILEAKKLLEQYAPKGEFLAYISRNEAKTLKELGGSGIIIEETGIPSFVPWLAIAVGISTAFSFMGSIRQSKNLAISAKWDKYHRDIKAKQDTILANQRAKKILSLKRATIGARGVEMGTGSTLIEQAAVIDNLEDVIFWINKGVEMDLRSIDLRLASSLSKESWERGSSLISGGLNTWSTAETGTL
jgi:hypothetical protein